MRRSISTLPQRHTVLDRRPGQYLCFPDVVREADGSLLAVYRETDQHVATRCRLLYSRSRDGGESWSAFEALREDAGHCPRASLDPQGRVIVIDELPGCLYISQGEGFRRQEIQTTAQRELVNAPLSIPDRILFHMDGKISSIAQVRLGSRPQSRYPTTGQAQWANLYYESEDGGINWRPLSVVGSEKDLSLCETSCCRLPDGRLLALMRENTGVYEPMYTALSEDDGQSWGPVVPTPLVGHRPCVGVTQSGKLLVTYRDVGPERATCAWLGSVEELTTEFEVHGSEGGQTLTPEGVLLTGDSRWPQFYALRPISNPRTASAELLAQVESRDISGNTGIQFAGIWWAVGGGKLCPELPGDPVIPLPKGSEICLRYAAGEAALYLDGQLQYSCPVEPVKEARRITVGHKPGGETPVSGSLWQALELHIEEPSYMRSYHWSWKPQDGFPDSYIQQRVLELKNAAGVWGGDYGYSGWVETQPGSFCCVYHHGENGLERARESYMMATRFTEQDFLEDKIDEGRL